MSGPIRLYHELHHALNVAKMGDRIVQTLAC